MEKRRKIFDDKTIVTDSIAIKKTNKKQELNVNVSEKEKNGDLTKFITVEDVIDMFAGYLPSQVNFMPKDGGECIFCGKETTSSMRKICFDCLKIKGEEIYNRSKHTIKGYEDRSQIK